MNFYSPNQIRRATVSTAKIAAPSHQHPHISYFSYRDRSTQVSNRFVILAKTLKIIFYHFQPNNSPNLPIQVHLTIVSH